VDALISLTAYPACRDLCLTVLSGIDAAQLERVARGLRHENPDVRRAVVEALARHPAAAAREFLRGAVNDPERSVQRAALTALAVLSTPPRGK
jgi:HEAT repeat protein